MNGRGGPIAPVNIQATDFRLKNHMIQQVQNSCQFHGLPGDDANKHLDKFLTITQSMKQNGVTDDALSLCLFPYSLTHHATTWFDRLLKNSIHTFQEMATEFLSKYFPYSMVTKLRNEISKFRQLPDESLFKAWGRYKLSIDRCPNHNMLPVTQIDTFYNRLTLRHRDTINAAVEGTFMKRRPEECYDVIENMTAHHNDWDTSAHRGELSNYATSSSSKIAALAQQMIEMRKDMIQMYCSNQQVNFVTSNCALPSNTIPNPREQINSITTRSGLTTAKPSIPPLVPPTPREEVEQEPKTLMDEVHITSPASTAHVPPLGIQPVSPPKPKEDPKPNPRQPKILKQLHFDISLMDALTQIPKYHKVLKDLLKDKEKLEELSNTLINVECSAILLNKVPEKLIDPGKFLIPCILQDLEVCNSLADSGASINLMPLSIYEKLGIGSLKPTRMTLELANRSVALPKGIAQDVIVRVDKFNFLADFIIVDFEADSRVPIILERPLWGTSKALVDLYEEKINFKNKPISGSTTSPSDSFSSSPLDEASDSSLEEFANELALLDPFPPGNEDDNFDPEADIREIEYLLNRDPSTDSLPKIDIDIIDPILERFTDEPALVYSFPPGYDDDDLFLL
ncbi:reverse transcriptase domain-containing protein [Tanacetum coccineum]